MIFQMLRKCNSKIEIKKFCRCIYIFSRIIKYFSFYTVVINISYFLALGSLFCFLGTYHADSLIYFFFIKKIFEKKNCIFPHGQPLWNKRLSRLNFYPGASEETVKCHVTGSETNVNSRGKTRFSLAGLGREHVTERQRSARAQEKLTEGK